ncbi:hypothetical protein B0H16DRAFT_1470228 [Mycena metata]|uniref:Uncharacterized protein n=1 Tax=Mycena metata TaxID=1033252 RepID=A0AAD7HV38_9AGAR|nr:hypothetical protein B0H16DRAFT_1470228 [Mycena metata]
MRMSEGGARGTGGGGDARAGWCEGSARQSSSEERRRVEWVSDWRRHGNGDSRIIGDGLRFLREARGEEGPGYRDIDFGGNSFDSRFVFILSAVGCVGSGSVGHGGGGNRPGLIDRTEQTDTFIGKLTQPNGGADFIVAGSTKLEVARYPEASMVDGTTGYC